jgi:phosphoadenosine phosphosulfate reductase
MTPELQKKVEQAVKLLQVTSGNDVVEVSYSGGKDSDVILELARMSGIKYRAIYKNTTIDPPGTIKHCIENGVEVMKPKMTFLHLVQKKGLPTRRVRFCCEVLKEYKVLDKAVQGIRRSESTARSKRYTEQEPVICRIYGSKKNHVDVILPILSWTDKDVAEFIAERGIKCHPLYYDEHGNFHAERRLGCIGCPLKSDAGRADYKAYPKLFKQVVKAVLVWWQSHPQSKSIKKFGTPYGLIAHNLFYRSYAEWQADDNNLFGRTDWKDFLEKQFNVKLPPF